MRELSGERVRARLRIAAAAVLACACALMLACLLGFPDRALAVQEGQPDGGALAAGQVHASGEALAAGQVLVATQAQTPQLATEKLLWAGFEEDQQLSSYVWDMPGSATVVKLKSSKTSVLKVVKAGSGNKLGDYELRPLKAGSANLSLTYTAKGKTATIKGAFTVKKFPEMIKSISFAGKRIAVPTRKNPRVNCALYEFAGTKGAFKVALAKGWEMSPVRVYLWKDGADEPSRSSVVENGATVQVPKNRTAQLCFGVFNDAGERFDCTVHVMRGLPVKLKRATCYIGHPDTIAPTLSTLTADAPFVRVTGLSSARPEVISATAGKSIDDIVLTPLAPGKSSLSLTYQLGGKSYTTSATYTVEAYPEAIKRLEVNGKSISQRTYPKRLVIENYKRTTATVSATPKKGWTLKSIVFVGANGKGKKVKDGASVKVPAKSTVSFSITMQDEAAETFEYYIELTRK